MIRQIREARSARGDLLWDAEGGRFRSGGRGSYAGAARSPQKGSCAAAAREPLGRQLASRRRRRERFLTPPLRNLPPSASRDDPIFATRVSTFRWDTLQGLSETSKLA